MLVNNLELTITRYYIGFIKLVQQYEIKGKPYRDKFNFIVNNDRKNTQKYTVITMDQNSKD